MNDLIKGFLYINNDKVGEVDFQVIDRSMGGIGGPLLPYTSYKIYQSDIRKSCEINGVANSAGFDLTIILDNNIVLYPLGGICVTDLLDNEEVYVDAAGVDIELMGNN